MPFESKSLVEKLLQNFMIARSHQSGHYCVIPRAIIPIQCIVDYPEPANRIAKTFSGKSNMIPMVQKFDSRA